MHYDPSEKKNDTSGGDTGQTDDSSITQEQDTTSGSVHKDSGAKEPGEDVQYENETIRKSIR